MVVEIMAIEEIFYELFFGSGGWLGLLLLLTIIVLLGMKSKVLAVLFIPLSIFLGVTYIQNVDPSNNLMWGGILMFLATIFLTVRLAKDDSF